VVGRAGRERRVLNVADVTQPLWAEVHLAYIPDVRAELAVPLLEGGQLRGVLNVESTEVGHFTARDEELLLAFANQAVIALQNAERYEEAQSQRARAEREARRVSLLYDASRQLTAATDEQQAYAVVAQAAYAHFGARVIIRRWSEARELLEPVYELGGKLEYSALAVGLQQSLNGLAARERRTINIDDSQNPPPGVPPFQLTDPDDRSVLVTPIALDAQNLYGTLGMSHRQTYYFHNSDLQLIEGLAQQLAIALQRLETTATEARLEEEKRIREAELMTHLGQNIAELTHDLGNDLGPIKTLLSQIRRELTAQQVVPPSVYDKLDNISEDVGRVLERSKLLKRELREMAQESRRAPAPQLVAELVLRALQIARVPRRIKVSNETATLELRTLCDAEEVLSILRCLITNAAEVMVKSGMLTLRARERGAMVLIEIEDTGPGIPRNLQRRIFDLGYSTKKSSGFGLWSARRNALLNGGDLQVLSEPGQGATFILCLPQAVGPS
jgi:GAF domain-containing protein